jgi:antitoxin ParD1/3/4
MANSGRNFSLTGHHQRFVDEQVENGRHSSGSEVVREALRRYEDDLKRDDAHLAYLNKLAEQGEAAYARGEYVQVPREALREFIGGVGKRASRRRTARNAA